MVIPTASNLGACRLITCPSQPRTVVSSFVAVLLAALLTGCGQSAATSARNNPPPIAPSTTPGPTPEVPASLCVTTSCGSKTALLPIPDAENILFTPEGRLFVSGGVNVYEVVANSNDFDAIPLLDGSCNFLGLAQRGNVLYANCGADQLYAAELTALPELTLIYQYTSAGMVLANGMESDAEGRLYTVNGPLGSSMPNPKIVRLTFDPSDPFSVTEEIDWLTTGLQFPNGIARTGDTFYVTDSNLLGEPGSIKRVDINPDGSAGTPSTIFVGMGVLDDLSLVGHDRLLATDFQNGLVYYLDSNGNLIDQSLPATFSFPSQVSHGHAPLFLPTDVLITEKGVLGDHDSAVGNVLSLLRPNQ